MGTRKKPLPVQHVAKPGTGGVGSARALCNPRIVVKAHAQFSRVCPGCRDRVRA